MDGPIDSDKKIKTGYLYQVPLPPFRRPCNIILQHPSHWIKQKKKIFDSGMQNYKRYKRKLLGCGILSTDKFSTKNWP